MDRFPVNTKDGESAPGPLTEKQRMGKMVVGKSGDVSSAERKEVERKMPTEPVPKAKGGYVKSADGCCKRGKTRGKMV